ncbi:serine hydrolase domain-containing protein [Mesoplasma florum]|uniref:serine hydrolase domain-containing protein n=1 Tax=Mesoplasma florum TaxID=2151 RepID=UPI000BE30B04|nr:serine hydrolase domain-containing protein [Mesoplasma florum]ATI73564.1 serine hydrolase [Mesoplasma florum]AVN61957.1 serine hydrolase [Mesoplasma florum]
MKNIEQKINEFISNNFYPGAVIKIDINGKDLYYSSFGYSDLENKKPMKKNQIFPIYSMTKPIVVVACLLLIQDGLLSLDTKVSDFYSNFNQNMKIKNLLNMTSGITYSWSAKNNIEKQIEIEEQIETNNYNLHEIIEMISKIPTEIEPGADWIYGMGIDVLGGIIEKVSGIKLSTFLKEKIFYPLKMNDTDFKIKDLNRKPVKYNLDSSNGYKLIRNENYHWMMPEDLTKIPNCCLGGSGVFTTASDYNKFLNFLLCGKIENKEYLDIKYLNEMTSNQITNLKNIKIFDLNEEYQYGYGVRVRTKNNVFPLTEVGEFGWGGVLGTTSLADPKNKVVMSFMVSVYPGNNMLVEKELFDALYKDLKDKKLI